MAKRRFGEITVINDSYKSCKTCTNYIPNNHKLCSACIKIIEDKYKLVGCKLCDKKIHTPMIVCESCLENAQN